MPKEEIRFTIRLSKEQHDIVNALFPQDNCRSQNEFVEKAIQFYAGYLATENAMDYLSTVLLTVMKGVVQSSENRLSRALFKQAVAVGMLTKIVGTYEGLDASMLTKLRGDVVEELKRTNGTLKLEDVVREQLVF